MDCTHQGARTLLLTAACLLLLSGPASGLGAGDLAPPFELPWLAEEGSVRAPEIFADHPVTVLMIWDRGCPHCTEVAFASPALADSVEPLGAHVIGIVMGPDDPEVLEELFWDEGVTVPHLWDSDRRTAGPYGLGFLHLGIFIVDRAGVIRASFDDKVSDPVTEIVPAVRAALAAPASAATPRAAASMPSGWPVIHLDGRVRMLSTEGARYADTGLFGEHLINGSMLLYRWDIGMIFPLAPGIEIEPFFRISNESDEVLTEGAERLSNRRGSISLRARRGPLAGALGAFDGRISPLLMQRWDEHDAPPIGGVSGCGVCGAGASGGAALPQYTLEVLDPSYTFEGILGAYAHRYAVLRAFAAVDRWESYDPIRFRRVLQGGSIDLGRSGLVDPDFGLPQPIGLRLGVVSVDDDQRTLPELQYGPSDREELGWVALARAGSFHGVSADAEWAGWSLRAAGRERISRAWRAGVHGTWTIDSYSLWSRVHGIRTDQRFDPMYRSLTYEPNREGFRIAGGVRLLVAPGASRERFGISVFYRTLDEVVTELNAEFRVASLSLSTRPVDDLLAQVSFLRIDELSQVPEIEDAVTAGISLDLRWEGWGTIDPMLHIETVENDPRDLDSSTLWQTYLSVRVVK